MKIINYVRCSNLKYINLNGLYNQDYSSLKNLDEVILNVIEVESPVSLNTLKARLREAMNIKKISQKALDIINERLDYYGIIRTNNFYEEILWPATGEFKIDYVRKNSELQIYDVAYQEMVNLAKDLSKNGLSGEELYRAILAFYNYEVLTEKALNFLKFIEEKIN